MKNSKKIKKGDFGYISHQRKAEIVKTLVMYGLCVAVYAVGLYTTGSNKNLLTIVAVLGCIPSSKIAVNMIMFLRAKGCSKGMYEKISACSEGLVQLYDMVFTSYERTYEISHLVYKANNLVGLTENSKCPTAAAEKHLLSMLAQDGIKDVTVKVLYNPDKYLKRLDQLRELEGEEGRRTEEVIDLLKTISI